MLLFGTLTGTFQAIQGNGQTYTTTYSPTGLRLTVVSVGNADLSLTMTESADPVLPGDQLTYTLTATNGGPDFTDMVIFDTLPAGVTLVSATPSNGECVMLSVLVCDLEGTRAEQPEQPRLS